MWKGGIRGGCSRGGTLNNNIYYCYKLHHRVLQCSVFTCTHVYEYLEQVRQHECVKISID